MTIVGWIIAGLIIGALAKFVMPGDDPGGIVVTTLLGMAGAVVGGMLGRGLGFYAPDQPAGWIMSILGAVLLLFAYRAITKRRSAH